MFELRAMFRQSGNQIYLGDSMDGATFFNAVEVLNTV
jgi:hypothetical protein